MSLGTNKRRLDRIEQKIGVNTFPADQRDPELVELMKLLNGDEFDINTVPFGISSTEFVKQPIDGMKGQFRTLQPVKQPPGGWPKEE